MIVMCKELINLRERRITDLVRSLSNIGMIIEYYVMLFGYVITLYTV
jgi:hypothetical protein